MKKYVYISAILTALTPLLQNPISYYKSLSKWKKRVTFLGITIFLIFILFLIVDLIFPLPKQKYYSQVIRAEDNTLLCAYLTPDDKWRLKTSLDEINPDMVKAILTKEDKYFYWHYGINPLAVGRALLRNIFKGKRTSGASTITMQLARMAAPASRTYSHKLSEMFRALQYEWHYSKREILEMYLSYLPYGGNIEGVHSASYIFFNRSPKLLSLSQSILLAVIPNRPNSLRLDKKVVEPREMRDKWIKFYLAKNTFPKANLMAALGENMGTNRFTIPPQTPHLCNYLHEKFNENELVTTINVTKQKSVENLLKNHVNRLRSYNISNGAVFVIDNVRHCVVAYCGSSDFQDKKSFGQVNGIIGLRSPGSALKPAIYGLGFDLGVITPNMKLPDVPSNFSGYAPENFDLQFRGMVTVHHALTNSLNLPPLWLLRDIGIDKLLNTLEQADFSDIKERRQKLGMSVALGGCGVTLEQITRFYSNFANEGKMYEVRYFKKDLEKKAAYKSLFSPAATYLLAEILSDLARPDLPQQYLEDSKRPKIAWKTGTSYGKRDAWAIGFSPRYTVGIWMGNFDGHGSPELTGASIAVPLLMDIFNSIDYNPNKKWFSRPAEVQKRKVCAETGLLPSKEDCPHLVEDEYITNVSPLNVCDLYQEVLVSENEDMQFCQLCCPPTGYKREKYPVYDSEVSLWMQDNHQGVARPPKHNPSCSAYFTGAGPKFISPLPNYTYYIQPKQGQQILLQAASGQEVSKHHWYVNDVFFATVAPGEKIFYAAKVGKLKVACVDDKGRKTEVSVNVMSY